MPIRRLFTQDPGVAELLSVGSLVIIDQAPPGTPLGAGTGLAICVGEFEKGPVNTPTEITTPAALVSTFGGFGWQVGTNPYAGPVAQRSGGNEPWNGNGYIALANKSFNRLAIQRVDNSSGSLTLQRLACLTGGQGPFSGSNGDQITFELDGGPTTATATLSVSPATILAAGAVYPLSGMGGKTLIVSWDDQDPITVIFLDTDTALADIISRINNRVAATIASDNGGQLQLDSIREGSDARMQIVGGTALADLGLPTAVVQDLWTATITGDTDASTVLQVSRIVDGVATTFTTNAVAGPVGSVTDKRDALLVELQGLGVPGFTFAPSGAAAITALGDANQILTGFTQTVGTEVTVVNTTPGVALEVYGLGNVGDSQNISTEEAANLIDAAANISGGLDADGNLRSCNELTPGAGTFQAISGALATAFGFDTSEIADANNASDVTIPAGTRFQDSTATATIWVSIEDVDTGTGGGPFAVKVRPFYDTDTALASSIGDVTEVLSTLPDGFDVTNATTLTRLSAAQLDARYIEAIQQTNVDAPPASEANYIFSARTSLAIRNELTQNCRATTAAGLAGRKTIVRPRLGVTVSEAQDVANELRDERKQVAFPGIRTAINEIRIVGTAGGVGFTEDGVIDAGADAFLCAYRTVINPEQSAAQQPSSTNYGPLNALGLESAYDPAVPGSTKLGINDYKLFKREGITALITSRTQGLSWNDDVTNSLDVGRTAANRRAFADFINDSLFGIAEPYKSKVATPDVKRSLEGRIRGFLRTLLSPLQPNASRLQGFDVEEVTDPAVPNLLRYQVSVTMYATADVIVNQTTIGPEVVTSQEVIAA